MNPGVQLVHVADGHPRPRRVPNRPKGEVRTNKLLRIIERDGLACFYCEHPLLDPRLGHFDQAQWWPTLDHLLPRSAGGTNALDNLVLACRACNGRKGDHVRLLVEVIRRLREQLAAARNDYARAHGFIDHLQWELFDAGLGEMPGHTELTRGPRKKLIRPKPRSWDVALLTEVGDRVCANLRAENRGGTHARTASVVKRGRRLMKREV